MSTQGSESQQVEHPTRFPEVGSDVWYRLPDGRATAAKVVMVHRRDIVDLVVFARPEDGAEYRQSGTAPKVQVRHIRTADPTLATLHPDTWMWPSAAEN